MTLLGYLYYFIICIRHVPRHLRDTFDGKQKPYILIVDYFCYYSRHRSATNKDTSRHICQTFQFNLKTKKGAVSL